MRRVLERERIAKLPAAGCLGSLVQIPVFVAMYAAVRQAAAAGGRFLWIGRLAKPDRLLALLVTALTIAASFSGKTSPLPSRVLLTAVSAVVTIAVMSKMAAGVGLYWALSSGFGAVQGWIVQRATDASVPA
jgi:membrane protein insertase Oxa1/YidC/SpoIIIJ